MVIESRLGQKKVAQGMLFKMQSISTLKKKNFGWAQAPNATDAKSPWKFEIFTQKNVFLFLCMRSIRLEDRDKIGAAKEAWYTYWTC